MLSNMKAGWITGWCLLGCCATAMADPVAYWRHEEGTPGSLIAAGPDTVLDSAGNGNHMQTFNPAFTSATYTSTVSPVPLRSGDPNTLSLDFGPGGDDAGLNDDNFTTAAKPVSSMLFDELTVEVAFKTDLLGQWQAILGKDGKPLGDAPGEDDSGVPPLKMLVRGDDFPGGVPNQLFVEWIDGDGTFGPNSPNGVPDVHFVASGFTIQPGEWYHVAFTLNATDAALWIAGEDGPYQLAGTASGDFVGPMGNVLVSEPLGWSTGRGMCNNNVCDWADALIDEVRISDMVLSRDEFLFNAIPEPASWALALLGIFGWGCGRRRRVG